MKLNTANNIYVGTNAASKVYVGTTQVWPQGSNVTPTMTMLDVPTFRTLNNISTTAQWSDYNGTYDIGNSARLTVAPPNSEILVGGVQHDHIYITADNSATPYRFVFEDDAVVTFKNRTYTKIVIKDTVWHQRDTSNIIVSSGTFVYDSSADEYVWSGNSNEVKINLNGVHRLDFKYIYFE